MTISLTNPTNDDVNESIMISGQAVKIIKGECDNFEDIKTIESCYRVHQTHNSI